VLSKRHLYPYNATLKVLEVAGASLDGLCSPRTRFTQTIPGDVRDQ
jgi:hypothetical protein